MPQFNITIDKDAKTLFAELGYTKCKDNPAVLVYSMEDYPYHNVCFYKKDKWFITSDDKDYGADITLALLDAINKQVDELKWR